MTTKRILRLGQPSEAGAFTIADLPEDGLQYELVEGTCLVTPARALHGKLVAGEISHALRQACPPEYWVIQAPMDYRPSANSSLQPDVIVASRDDPGPDALSLPLLLAVEILSPVTRLTALVLKRSLYEEAGVKSYWLFDPATVELTVLELEDGRYVERAMVKGDEAFEARLPFEVRVVPTEFVRRISCSAS